MTSIDHIIFDIDGTLVLLPIDWKNVVARIRAMPNIVTKSFLGFIAKYYGSSEFWYIHRYLEDIENKAIDNIIVLDNADNIIQALCNKIHVGFITMQSRSIAQKIIARLGLDRCINNLGILSSRDDASNRVIQLSKAIKILTTESNKVLFIGDKILDAIAGIVNNVNTIVVFRGLNNMQISATDYIDEDFESLGVYIAKSLGEALQIARDIFGIEFDYAIHQG